MIKLKTRNVFGQTFGGTFLALLAYFGSFDLYINQAYADDIYTIVVKKQDDKDRYRWSLSDWLNTRDKMRLMDLWLALHSPSPYEFFLGGNYQFDQASPGSNLRAWELSFAAFVSIFGLEARYESNMDNRWSGIFDLRIFGYHDQSTNITLQGGLRNRCNASYSFINLFAGTRITVYLARAFGINLLYRHFFSTSDAFSLGLSGDRFQGGAFLDFKFLRLYGDYFTESDGASTLNGIVIGPQLYF